MTQSTQLYLRLLSHVRPYRAVFAIAIISMITLATAEPAMAYLLKPMLDGSFVQKDPDMIRLIPFALIGISALYGVSSYISRVSIHWVANRVVMDLRELMFKKLTVLPTRFFDNATTGSMISKLSYDVTQITSVAAEVIIILVKESLVVVGLISLMVYHNWQLSMIAFTTVPVIAWVVRVASKRQRRSSRSLQEAMGEMTHISEEAITGHKVVKVFGGQDYERSRFQKAINRVRGYTMKIKITSALYMPLVQFLTVLALAVIVYLAALQSARGEFTVGEFMSFFAAMGMLLTPIKRLTSVSEKLQMGLAALESIFFLIDDKEEDDKGTANISKAEGSIEFRNVWLNYDNDAPALRGIDLNISPGETIALVGQSGSGKSSLASLIPRFYNVSDGQILVDGKNLEDIRLSELRRNISYVSQEIILFNDSIAANIAYGTLEQATEEQILDAARSAHALEFIEQQTDGLQTLIGERGLKLSGGQLQRLAIARAILKNAPILILDEATSALDTESEKHIQAAIDVVKQGRTTIIIAHRLSTIENADRIAVMESGKIIECGTHQELIDIKGAYTRLHQMQFSQ